MSGDFEHPTRDPQIERLVHELGQPSAEDQELVHALIARLAGVESPGFAPDVAFMDFDEYPRTFVLRMSRALALPGS